MSGRECSLHPPSRLKAPPEPQALSDLSCPLRAPPPASCRLSVSASPSPPWPCRHDSPAVCKYNKLSKFFFFFLLENVCGSPAPMCHVASTAAGIVTPQRHLPSVSTPTCLVSSETRSAPGLQRKIAGYLGKKVKDGLGMGCI